MAAAVPDLDEGFRRKLQEYALTVAGRTLAAESGADLGPEPEAPRPQLALPPGPSAPELPRWRERDSVDEVLDQLAAIQDEFGDLLNEEGDDGPEDDQGEAA
ncbi:hypothetical protein [Streptomyces canus]|uniref:hypothetical protein n=1 Tax=Streptomyces canus TaxID=58343 RepID=UPI00036540B2|nr:hypothetical protein [Streptomyces canus]